MILPHLNIVPCQPPVLTVTVYRPPKQCPTFLTDFLELLSIIHTNYDKIIITGDFNLILTYPWIMGMTQMPGILLIS